MKLSTSVKTALAILALTLGYFAVRTLFSGGAEEAAAETGPALFTVIAQPVAPSEWRDEVTVSGRTKALRKVEVRAETAGSVAETPGRPGTFVTAGTVLCKLNIDARQSSLAEARASLAKADLDYNAALELAKDGFRSDTSVAAMKASRLAAISSSANAGSCAETAARPNPPGAAVAVAAPGASPFFPKLIAIPPELPWVRHSQNMLTVPRSCLLRPYWWRHS